MRISRFPSLVDDVSVRLIAGVVLLLAVVALAAQQWWLYPVLALDFILRAGWGPSASPVARLVQRALRPRLSAAPRYTPGPPKRFAAALGAGMTTAATTAWALGAEPAVVAIGAVMVIFPALEAIFGICAGCIVFGWLMRAGVVPEDICVECADLTRRAKAAQSAQSAGGRTPGRLNAGG